MKKIIFLYCISISTIISAQDTATERKITNLISKMTFEEKIGQMSQLHVYKIGRAHV